MPMELLQLAQGDVHDEAEAAAEGHGASCPPGQKQRLQQGQQLPPWGRPAASCIRPATTPRSQRPGAKAGAAMLRGQQPGSARRTCLGSTSYGTPPT
jgi:hypothetical protein